MIDINGNLLNPFHIVSIGPLIYGGMRHAGSTGNDKKNFQIVMCDGKIYTSRHKNEVEAKTFRDDVASLYTKAIENGLAPQCRSNSHHD